MTNKMKFGAMLMSLLLTLSFSICNAQKKHYDPIKSYNIEELKEDLIYTKMNLEKYHPGLYWYVSKPDFNKLCDSLLQEIDRPMTEIEFFPYIQLIFNKVSEKHAGVFLSDKGHKWLKKDVKTFPFSIKYINEKLFIKENGSENIELKKGTEILSINERSTTEILQIMKSKMISDGNNTTAIIRYDVERDFWKRYYLMIDENQEFELGIKRVGSEQIEQVHVIGITRSTFEERMKDQKVDYLKNFEILENQQTAIFTLNTFLGKKGDNTKGIASASKYTEYVFEKLEANPSIENLIIDVRNNGGGRPGTEISILKYLNGEKNKVYKTIERNSWDIFFKKENDNKYRSSKFLGYAIEPNENRFEGQIFLLTSGRTYSAASLFAVSLDQFTNAIVVGEETGGGFYGTTAGKWENTYTPNVKLDLHIPKIRFLTNASGQPEGRGLLPDLEVTQTFDDFMSNTDTEMEYTLDLIKKLKESGEKLNK